MVIPNLPLMAVHHGCPSSIMAVYQCGVANTRLLHRTEAVKRGPIGRLTQRGLHFVHPRAACRGGLPVSDEPVVENSWIRQMANSHDINPGLKPPGVVIKRLLGAFD